MGKSGGWYAEIYREDWEEDDDLPMPTHRLLVAHNLVTVAGKATIRLLRRGLRLPKKEAHRLMGLLERLGTVTPRDPETGRWSLLEEKCQLEWDWDFFAMGDELPWVSRFEQFVPLASNRDALAAAHQVAEQPGKAHNPLFIVGEPGVGTSHLMYAIGYAFSVDKAGSPFLAIDGEALRQEADWAVMTERWDDYWRALRRFDLIMVRNASRLWFEAPGKNDVMATLEAMVEEGKQIVFTFPPDAAAWAWAPMKQTFGSFLERGTRVDVQTPDREDRLAFLTWWISRGNGVVAVDEDGLELLADAYTDTIQALKGALWEVGSYGAATFSSRRIDREMVEHVIRLRRVSEAGRVQLPKRCPRGRVTSRGGFLDGDNSLTAEPEEGWTFATFVAGSCNRTALELARLVVDAPERVPCPLVITGEYGMGKSHLVHAIVNRLRVEEPNRRVRLMDADFFSYAFWRAAQKGRVARFREALHGSDVLLVEDLHLMKGRDREWRELRVAVKALYEAGKCVVLSMDAHGPEAVATFLKPLWDGGRRVVLSEPDRETLRPIMKSWLRRQQGMISEDALDLIEERRPGNWSERRKQAWSLALFSRGEPVTKEVAEAWLRDEGVWR